MRVKKGKQNGIEGVTQGKGNEVNDSDKGERMQTHEWRGSLPTNISRRTKQKENRNKNH